MRFNNPVNFIENLEDCSWDNAIQLLDICWHICGARLDNIDYFVGTQHGIGLAGPALAKGKDGAIITIHQSLDGVTRYELVCSLLVRLSVQHLIKRVVIVAT